MTIVVADEGLLGLAEMAPAHWQIRHYTGRVIDDDLLAGADALLVRSTVVLDVDRLPSSVQFIGTATIGTDHLPRDPLAARGIEVASAPGCNALAVTDYVLANLLEWAACHDRDWQSLCLAVIGVGAVGARLVARAERLGLRVVCSDAPRAEAGTLPTHQPLADVLASADVVSVHVPLTDVGNHPTRHLFDRQRLAQIRADGLFINASRGGVTTEDGLLACRCDLVLDVFPDEPVISDPLLERAWRVSPHIAGHSVEGKLRGTAQVVEALCRRLGEQPKAIDLDHLSTQYCPRVQAASEIAQITASCPMTPIDASLRKAVVSQSATDRAVAFDRVRRDYPLRRESVVDF